jgi:hypothetical protein
MEILLKYILETEWEEADWTHLGSCKHRNEPSDSIKCEEFID